MEAPVGRKQTRYDKEREVHGTMKRMNHRALAWLMTLLTLCTFTAAAVAGDVLPEDNYPMAV